MASDARKHTMPNKRLANERKKRHWTQSDLASELYDLCDEEELDEHGTIDVNMVSKWERGLHTPRFFWQRKLCTLFGLDAQALGFVDQGETEGPDRAQEFPLVRNTGSVDLDEGQPLHIILPPLIAHIWSRYMSTTLPHSFLEMLQEKMVCLIRGEYMLSDRNICMREDMP